MSMSYKLIGNINYNFYFTFSKVSLLGLNSEDSLDIENTTYIEPPEINIATKHTSVQLRRQPALITFSR